MSDTVTCMKCGVDEPLEECIPLIIK